MSSNYTHVCGNCGERWWDAHVCPNAPRTPTAPIIGKPMTTTQHSKPVSVERTCSTCKHSDSWGLPDCVLPGECGATKAHWEPLNPPSTYHATLLSAKPEPAGERGELIERLVYAAYSWGFEVAKSGQTTDSTIAMNRMSKFKDALLAADAQQPALKPLTIPDDVVRAAESFKKNGYRGPLAWAQKVFDWVVSNGIKEQA